MSDVRLNIEKAYCCETCSVINIYEAKNYYFSQVEPRQRLNFLCSDEQCRYKSQARVTAVNYDKLSQEDGTKYMKAHFRENSRTPHIPECEWVLRAIAHESLRAEHTKASGTKLVANASKKEKRSDVVNFYNPVGGTVQTTTIEKISGEANARPKGNRQDRIERYKREYRENLNKTSVLHEVVTCYLDMNYSERVKEPLKIPGCGCSIYAECFVHVKRAYPGIQGRILRGGAIVKSFGSNFSVRFYDPVLSNRGEASTTHGLFLYLTKEEISNYRFSESLRVILHEAAEEPGRMYVNCYFYGSIAKSEKIDGACDVHLDTLDNLVMILIEKPRNQD